MMKSLEFCNRNKKEFEWENEDLRDDKVIEEGQPKLVHPDIINKIPGVVLESDYNEVIGQAHQEEDMQSTTSADCATIT